jgi:hypothetical protein
MLTQLEIRILVITTGTLSPFSAHTVPSEVVHDLTGGAVVCFCASTGLTRPATAYAARAVAARVRRMDECMDMLRAVIVRGTRSGGLPA